MREGFYYLKTRDNSELPVLVHGYNCTDLGGKFVFGFNTYDGGGLVELADLLDNTIVVPVTVSESQPAESSNAETLAQHTTGKAINE